jgi:maltose/maltodextrin transport system permease protein
MVKAEPVLLANDPALQNIKVQIAADKKSAKLTCDVVKPSGGLLNKQDGSLLRPNFDTGFYETANGERVQPGFQVGVGWANFQRIFTDQAFRQPFIRIFVWTVVFSALTVFFGAALGMFLAVLFNWDALRFTGLYRTMLFLPYAVPGFISILVFKGLFNNNFGEINLILEALFGIRPAWFSDPLLAKVMLLIVNVWLGYPYMMVVCMGLIKAIPADLYEASAVAGAGPLTNFFRITLPLILKPLTPLLISAFAFNFNNFVLVSLLTGGRPDFLDTSVPAGTTDLLVSYTYRIAFQDSGAQYGLAAAISTVIFVMVAGISLLQMRFTRIAHAATLSRRACITRLIAQYAEMRRTMGTNVEPYLAQLSAEDRATLASGIAIMRQLMTLPTPPLPSPMIQTPTPSPERDPES